MSEPYLRSFICDKCNRLCLVVGEDMEPTSNYCWNCHQKAWEKYLKNPENLKKELEQETRYDEYLEEQQEKKIQKIMKEKNLRNKNEYRIYMKGYWNGYFMGISRGKVT